ncbi:hypothetical protein [Pelagicoccus mobilis]|uniref:Glycoside hydrolase family 42 N-terminal domain-containing protein n=1 Tax=Pelagicoccus mobilis TaxID=415221 RepID=A0A934RVA8_9BACT|nr:hypothetical protein [Pelagicoccus mobilis]MBK1875476.1 hypothetical protein [Pelagicoccus mobilis]
MRLQISELPRSIPSLLGTLFLVVAARAETTLVEGPIELNSFTDGQQHTIQILDEVRDFSNALGIKVTVENSSDTYCRVEGWFMEKWMNVQSAVHLPPGSTRDLTLHLTRHNDFLGNASSLFPDMRAMPGGTIDHWARIDLENDSKTVSFAVFAESPVDLELTNLRAYGSYRSPQEMAAEQDFFPFIDQFGQYKHEDWPGKIHNETELLASIAIEELELDNHPPPANRNQYGGWATGPKREATGHFRVEKIDGKWWLIDPSGCLFWSYGATGFGFSFAETKTEGRENFFENLPESTDSGFGQFVDPNSASFGGRTYEFGPSNLYRKFGDSWIEQSGALSLRRIKSWGMNTMGCWSDSRLFNDQDNPVPYTLFLGWNLPTLSVDANGSMIEFPDPFDSDFRSTVYGRINGARDLLNSEWCLGYFFQNEYHFRKNNSDSRYRVAYAYMQADDESDAKEAIIDFLQKRHTSISALNTAWGTQYSSWANVRALDEIPSGGDVDAMAWEEAYADRLYQTIKEEGQKVSPALFLGSRFIAFTPFHIMNAAAPHIDVIGINWYRYSPNDIPVSTIDKPIIIGEFHFGAVERGYFHTGLRAVGDQNDRAEAMYHYLRDALQHDRIVGAHWFQYRSQAVTGRKDGENFQIGLVDLCDSPYPETRTAARSIGKGLYRIRGAQYLPPDLDNDGIPDSVESTHGLDPSNPADASFDLDEDSKSNLVEYVLGTDLSAASELISPSIAVASSRSEITIPENSIQAGRRYLLLHSNDLKSAWKLVDYITTDSTTDDPMTWTLPESITEGFYRIQVELVD